MSCKDWMQPWRIFKWEVQCISWWSIFVQTSPMLDRNLRILPNRSDVLPVNMRCKRAAIGQYEVACRGVWTCLKSVRFFCWFCLCLVSTIFRGIAFESHSPLLTCLGCVFWTDQIVRSACSSIAPHVRRFIFGTLPAASLREISVYSLIIWAIWESKG